MNCLHQAVTVLEEAEIELQAFSDNDLVATKAASLAHASGLTQVQTQMLITASFELANNILIHAGSGLIRLQRISRQCDQGVRLIAIDKGPGIADINQAMVDGFTTQPKFSSLGLGLGGVSRLMDSMEIDSCLDRGTSIACIKWSTQPYGD